MFPPSSSSDTAGAPHSSSPSSSTTVPPSYIQLPPPPCFSSFAFSQSPSHPSPDPFDRTPTSPSIYYTAPSSPYAESPANSEPSSPLKSPGSPPPLPGLHITIPSGPLPRSPNYEPLQSEAFPTTDVSIDIALDDEGLSPLEKIYLFSRNNDPFHRVFIIHAMPSFLEQVTPLEADEYVLPLLRGLATDDDETVKEALAAELVPIIWWFFTHCQIVPEDVKATEFGQPSSSSVTTICVQAFTPILGRLLLSPNPMVGGPTRSAVVEILAKMRRADIKEGLLPASMDPTNSLDDQAQSIPQSESEADLVIGLFGKVERELFEHELLQHVVIGMGRLDMMATDNCQEPQPEEYAYEDWNHSSQENSPAASSLTGGSTAESSPDAMDVDVEERTPMLEEPVNPYFPHRAPAPSPSASSSSESTPSMIASSSTTTSSPSSTGECLEIQESASNNSGSTLSPPIIDGIGMEADEQGWMDHNMEGDKDKYYDAEYYLPNEVSTIDPYDCTEEVSESSLEYGAFEYPEDAAVDIDDYGDELDFDQEQAAVGRVSSMSLMAATAASGTLRDETKLAFVKEVERVGRDHLHWVRREASFAVGALAKVVPTELVICSLFPLFESLRQDPVWHVRQSALFALPAILSRLPPQRRRILAMETVLPLSKDASSNVRTGVMEALGEVIYTFHKDENGPPEQLLHLFLGRKEDKRLRDGQQEASGRSVEGHQNVSSSTLLSSLIGRSGGGDTPLDPLEAFFLHPDRAMVCAFNFPAVSATLGQARWIEIREYYLQLAQNRMTGVRRTLAASLGAMAKIIGEENAESDLMDVWWGAIRCEEEDVRMKAVECVGEFVSALSSSARLEVLRGLYTFWSEGLFRNWRERERIADILGDLSQFVGLADTDIMRGLLMLALQDGVAAIREAAVSSLPVIRRTFMADARVLRDLHDDVLSLSRSANYRWRMSFIACQQILTMPPPSQTAAVEADEDFWLSLAPLTNDKIVGVRISIARLIGVYLRAFHQSSHHASNETLSKMVKTLRGDSSHEVRSYVPSVWLEDTRADGNVPGVTPLRFKGAQSSIFSKPPPIPSNPADTVLAVATEASLQVQNSVRAASKPVQAQEDIGSILFNKLQQIGEARVSAESAALSGTHLEMAQPVPS
ncbi:ARM repeat-containing protein [Pleurotus pulmonarius]